MTADFALGVLVGMLSSAGFAAGYGYHRLQLVVANRSPRRVATVGPDMDGDDG